MVNVLKHKKYTIIDTDADEDYRIYRNSITINNDFKENVPEYIFEDMGIYFDSVRGFHYVRFDEDDKKYYSRQIDVTLEDYNNAISQNPQDWTIIKESLAHNTNPEYEAIPDDDDTVEPPMGLERGSNPDDEKKTKTIEKKNKYFDAEIEKYNKFVQEFNMMMSEEYSKSFRTKKYNELMKKLSEDKKLLEMLQDESFFGDEGKNILNTMNKIYNKWQER